MKIIYTSRVNTNRVSKKCFLGKWVMDVKSPCTLLIGRPHGGCFIYKNYLHSCIKIIPTLSDRFCCVSLTLSRSCIIYMFCVCMPCDNNNIASLHVYVDILTQISAICSKYDAEYICIGGDMNTDLVRLQSQNTQALVQFAAKENLQFALNHSISDITHTFTSFAFDSFSTIDHFIITLDNPTVINPCSAVRAPRQLWDRADNTDRVKYRARLDHNLCLLHLPRDCINCTDYLYTDYSHVASIQLFHDNLIESCLEASKLFQSQKKNPKLLQAGMSMLNSTSRHRNFGILFGRNAARLEMVTLLKL